MSSYTPRPGSVSTRVLEFFRANPDEDLTIDDIAQKFDATRNNVHTLLTLAIDNELLARSRNEDGEYVYHLPSHKPARKQGNAAPASQTAKTHRKPAATSVRKTLDMSTLVVDENVPFIGDQVKGESKWAPFFAKFTKPGQSIAIPGDLRGAVGAAANKINTLKVHGKFRVARTGADEARVWRIA
jgi:hypothetical protein